ncbi:hypothetical protein [Rhizobium lusitanum]|uniref:CHASE2 domain-containing sensor protein n=1 Tax=Rhizobium lusitanum TaxID=293958 RepID=A0A7X0IPU6_9HYPH|nr:hypothetical protein [Rhizobium lusitanum]MBB6484634.1 CHASE2 domain-containing sensor protein [Rhizobium lusitanum]
MFRFLMLAVLAAMLLTALLLMGATAALTGAWIRLAVPVAILVATVVAVGFALSEQS